MGNDHASSIMFARFGDHHRLCARLLSHDSRKLTQQQFTRGHSFGEPEGEKLSQGRLFFASFRRRAIKIGECCFRACLVKPGSQFTKGVYGAGEVLDRPAGLIRCVSSPELTVGACGAILIAEHIENGNAAAEMLRG